jgi:K+-transporting ATPase ATPase C chain
MLQELRPAFVALIVLSVITGLVYPFAVTGIAQAVFPERANGSLVFRGDRCVGSRLIGQSFDDPRYFWGRLSGTTPAYNGGASAGTNYGPSNPALRDAAKTRLDALMLTDGEAIRKGLRVPVDLATASGSGLDPHVSPASARYQVSRVAAARGISRSRLAVLVEAHVEPRQLGVLGEPRVNVLELNLALDAMVSE